MSLGDHFRELRARVMRITLYLVVGTIIALFFYDFLFQLILDPYNDARRLLGQGTQTQAVITGVGTPLLLQLYFVFYLLPGVFPLLTLSPLQAGIIGLAINYSAYEAENYRAGLLAIPRGQMEAALSLGMTPVTAIRRVIVPQALRIVIPPVTNDFIALFKDTSVCSVILITELTRKYNELYNFNRDYIAELAFVTAGLYLVMSYPMALLAQWLERHTSAGGVR